MGKRKSRKQPQSSKAKLYKALTPLETQFDCPFCNHEKCCEVHIDRVRKAAEIICRVCQEKYQTVAHNLSEPIDVYNDWIDACEEAN